MKGKLLGGIGVLAVAGAFAAVSPAAPERSSGTLQLRAAFGIGWSFSDSYCPPGTGRDIDCGRYRGVVDIPGLGKVTKTYVKTIENNGCSVTEPRTVVLEVAGKGRIELAITQDHICSQPAPAQSAYTLRITGGSGAYAGATGDLEHTSSVYAPTPGCFCGQARDTLTGELNVPGLEFDLTPPVLSGARSKLIRAPKGSRRARVRYTVKAQDAVDGLLRVDCAPRSGSLFKVGRTRVRCSATDSSANTTRSQFTVTVRR